MRVLLLTTLLMTACFSPNEASISQSAAVNKQKLIDVNSPAYIEAGECLIDIKSTLALGTTTDLLPLNSCLPSSKLSWLFEAERVTAQAEQHLKLAVLLDTSYSLRENDPQGERYNALRTYLLALHEKITTEDRTTEARIASAEIQIYPFKYCDSRKDKNHSLEINQNTRKDAFEKEIDALIGDKSTYANRGNAKDVRDGKIFEQLTGYGAVGSTNYLHSLAKAIEFFDVERNNDLKQVLIFSDGLPFTFNDGTGSGANNTIDLSAPGCGINHGYTYSELRSAVGFTDSDKKFIPSEAIKACVSDKFYPKDTCTRPTRKNPGQTRTNTVAPAAWGDPLNHVLGMVQHSTVIKKAKDQHDFQIYSVLLHPSSCNSVKDSQDSLDKSICKHITARLAKPFFESFADSYEETSKANELADKLRATLAAQTLEYHKFGKAKIDINQVDEQTKWHTGNLIKVGRDKKSDSVYDYTNETRATLTVEHSLYHRGGNFSIAYDFEFPASGKGEADCRSSSYSDSGNVEVNKYSGRGYTAWCLLSPRCDADNRCCDADHQEITAARGQQICDSEEGDRLWIGFVGNRRVCACECNDTAAKACQGEDQHWNATTCTCEVSEGGGKEACVPSLTVCCKNGTAHDVLPCAGKAGETWDSTECRCVTDVAESPPTERGCDSNTECCDSAGKVITPRTCPAGESWQGHSACKCVPQSRPRLRVTPTPPTPPTNPAQTEGGKDVPPEKPENPEKTGEEKGEEEEPPPAAAVTESIIWGEFESF